MKTFRAESDLKKYSKVNAYTFESQSEFHAWRHLGRRLRLSDYEIDTIKKQRKIRIFQVYFNEK